MPCPTCDHTMHCVTPASFGMTGLWWCPRCGTIKRQTDTPNGDVAEAPKLVERCREFERRSPALLHAEGSFWHSLGIADCLHTHEDRP